MLCRAQPNSSERKGLPSGVGMQWWNHKKSLSQLNIPNESAQHSKRVGSTLCLSRLNAPRESAQHYLWVGSNRGLSYGGKTTETSEQSNGLRVDQTACSRKSDTACIVFSRARCSLRNRYKMVLNILYINIITCITPDTNRYSKVYRLYRWRYSIRCWIICW